MKEYIHYGSTRYIPERVLPIRNRAYFTKPAGGLWASATDAAYGWKDWNDEEEYRVCEESNSFKFTLRADAKVLNINKLDDLATLPADKSIKVYKCLDFEKLAQDYDAIEVMAGSNDELYYELYGWDCDSILIMNPDIIQITNG